NSEPLSVLPTGLPVGVTYTTPAPDYVIAAPIAIFSEPQNVVVCTNETAVFVIDATPEATIQWQFKNESGTFENLADGGPFTGTSTPNLNVQAIGNYLNGTVFRAKLTREGNGCNWFSNEVTLNV